jgi:hypothetical protein
VSPIYDHPLLTGLSNVMSIVPPADTPILTSVEAVHVNGSVPGMTSPSMSIAAVACGAVAQSSKAASIKSILVEVFFLEGEIERDVLEVSMKMPFLCFELLRRQYHLCPQRDLPFFTFY